MPAYDYLCPSGHYTEAVFSIHEDSTYTPCSSCAPRGSDIPGHSCTLDADDYCEECGFQVPLARKVIRSFPGVTHGLVRETHYNTAVGRVVRNDADFKSALSEWSDERSEYNGFPVNFQPIDHRDAGEHLGVTDEGMDATYSKQVESGEREVIKHL